MKKLLTLLLALAMILALAACGQTKDADVVENVEPGTNPVVIETPPAIVSGPDTPVENYPVVDTLPETAPADTATDNTNLNPNSNPSASAVAGPAVSPSVTVVEGNTGSGYDNTMEYFPPATINENPEITFADDTGEMYYPTATDWEKQNAKQAYTNVLHANFRVGPGTQYKIYESLPLYADVRVISFDGNWAKIWYNGSMLGYVYKSYITFGTPPKT